MEVYTKTINIPIEDSLYEIKIQHDQHTDKMVIKVDGVEQEPEIKKSVFFGPTTYKVKIGNKNSQTRRFREAEEKLVVVTTKKPVIGNPQYSITIDGKSIQSYKAPFKGKWFGWKLEADSEDRIFLDFNQQNVWMGGRVIGRPNGFENINFAVRNVPGYVERKIKFGEQEFVAFYDNRRCRPLKYDEQEI